MAAVALLALAIAVLPRAFGGPTEPAGAEGPTITVMAANMMLGAGSPESLAGLVDEVDPDVLSVEELTPGLAGRLDRLGFADALPDRELMPAAASRGSGLYSRLPLRDGDRGRSPGGFPLISATIDPPDAVPVEVTSIHTRPPNVTGWERDLDAVPAAAPGRAQILLGDFNATLDHAAFRRVLDRGWDDAAATLGAGLTPTWPLGRGILPPLVAIDHVLTTPVIGIRAFSAADIDGSDHRVVSADLALPAE